MERPLNWRGVDVRSPWADRMVAPIPYVSGDATPNLTDAGHAALAGNANAGGLIFTHADLGSAPSDAWFKQVVRKGFPKYERTRATAEHPLNAVLFRLGKPLPQLEAVTNGSG